MTSPPIPGNSAHEEFARLWAVLDRAVEQNAKNAELLTRLGCTVENMIEMQATGTPRCVNHTDRLLTIEKDVDLLTSGQHPQWESQSATLKNWVMVSAGASILALITAISSLAGALR